MSGPVADNGWQWSVLMILWSVFYLIYSPDFLTLTTMMGWSLIGIGEILLFLAPIFPNKIQGSFLRNLHAGIILLSTTAIFLYQFDFPILEMIGGEVRIGYYFLVLSSFFLLAASISKVLCSDE
jgi:hypothetical protein